MLRSSTGFSACAFPPSAIPTAASLITSSRPVNWVNGTVSDNADWARNDYNREHVEGGRLALKVVLNDNWSATVTYGFQRQGTLGAWDEDPRTTATDGRALRSREPSFRSQDG